MLNEENEFKKKKKRIKSVLSLVKLISVFEKKNIFFSHLIPALKKLIDYVLINKWVYLKSIMRF